MKKWKRISSLFMALALVVGVILSSSVTVPVQAATLTPVQIHGQLLVSGTKIVDQNGNAFQLWGSAPMELTGMWEALM